MTVPMGSGTDGAWPRRVSEDDRHNYRDEYRKSDAQDEEGDGTELAAATVLILFLTLPATSLLR